MSRNSRNVPFVLAGLLLSIAMSMMATAALAAAPITMNDLLNAESISDAQFAPGDSGAFAFVRGIPIASQNTWGYQYSPLVRSRVFVVTRSGVAPKEIPNSAEVRYTLISWGKAWSPDGRELLLLATTRKGYGLAIYDLASGKIMRLPGYVKNFLPLFAWTHDDRLVYYAIPEGVRQRGADNQVLANVKSHWTAAWTGDKPQVTVSSTSPVFQTSEAPPGTLMLADPHNGSIRKLATGDFYAISVSPHDRHIAVVRAAERLSSAINIFDRRGELQIFALKPDDEAPLLYRYADIDIAALMLAGDSLAWSSAGDRLLTVGSPVGQGRLKSNLYVVDAKSGLVNKMETPQELSFMNPTATAWGMGLPIGWIDGRPVAVAARKSDADAKVPASPPEAGTHMDYGGIHQWRFDVYAFGAGQSAQDLTRFSKASVDKFLVASGGSNLVVVTDGALWKLVPGRKPTRLTPDSSRILGFGVGGRYDPLDSAYFRTATQERIGLTVLADGKPERVVLNLKSGELIPLKVRGDIVSTASNQLDTLSKDDQGWTSTLLLTTNGTTAHTILTVNAGLKDKAVAKAKSFGFTYEGKELTGWILLPPNAKPGIRLPAVVSVYGGTVFGTKPPSQAEPGYVVPVLSGQLLAAQGYAVVYPSTPVGEGSTTDVMKTLAGEAVAAADAVATKGIIDPHRVGVMGQSFGGYSTAAILAERSDYFRAGVAMAGVYDWMAGYGMLPIGDVLSDDGDISDVENRMIEDGQIRLGKPFWKAREAYMRNSPIFRVEDIDSPLLLLHGDLDLGVTGLLGAERMYNTMLRAGKDNFALVRYWGQGHVADSASAISDQWSRIIAWFDHYLKAGTQHSASSTR